MARPHPDRDGFAIAIAGVALLGAMAWLAHAHRRAAPRAVKTASDGLVVPRASGTIVDDGNFEEPAWRDAAMGGAFTDDTGGSARPHSEIRFLWSLDGLHLAVYAADGDIEERGPAPIPDAFSLQLGREGGPVLELVVTPSEVREEGAHPRVFAAGHDVDGTVGDPSDDDEEWVTELTVPWSALGAAAEPGERLVVSARRCDVTKDSGKRCGAMKRTVLTLSE